MIRLFCPFTLTFLVSLSLKCVFCRQHIVESYFIIGSDTFCLLIGLFNPFTFNVTDIVGFRPAIYFFWFFLVI